MLDCLYAQCTPYITDCVMAELEKLGAKPSPLSPPCRCPSSGCGYGCGYVSDCGSGYALLTAAAVAFQARSSAWRCG